MIFDRIEILYDRYCLPIKIKYSETRKPSFVEFLILSIIINHPYPNKKIKDILYEDFKVEKQELFEKAFQDLVTFKIIKLKSNLAGFTNLDLEIEINKIEIDSIFLKRFKANEYWISQSDKVFEVKRIFDPISNEVYLVKEIDWSKKTSNSKISSKLENLNLNNSFYEKENIFENAKKFIKNNKDLFSEKTNILDIYLATGISLSNKAVIESLTEKIQRAVEIWIEINNVGDFKIQSKDKSLEVFLNTNKQRSKNILLDVTEKYASKVRTVFIANKSLVNEQHYIRSPELVSNIVVKSNANILLVNAQNLTAVDEFLKNKDFLSNIKYLIIYNSKTNQKTIEVRDERFIIHTDLITSTFLQENSLIYVDKENLTSAYSIVDHIGDFQFPVVYTSNIREKISLIDFFKNSLNRVYNDFKSLLKNQEWNKASIFLKAMSKISSKKIIEEMLINFLSENFNAVYLISEFWKTLQRENNKEGLKIFENCWQKILLYESKNLSDEEIVALLKEITFTNRNILEETIEKIKNNYSKSEYNFVLELNKIFANENINLFEDELRSANQTLWEFAQINLRKDLLDINLLTGEKLKKQSRLINMIGSIIKEALNQNLNEVKILYKDLLEKIFEFTQTFSKIETWKEVLPIIADCLNQFYEIINPEIQKLRENYEDLKKQEFDKKQNMLTEYNDVLNKYLKSEQFKWPLEIKVLWIENTHLKGKNLNSSEILKIRNSLLDFYLS